MDAPVRQFRDRAEAGRLLAAKLAHYANRDDVLVLALPRGGVPVAFEIARSIHAPLDVFLVRKIAAPGQEELAMGAVATGNVRILQRDVIQALGISEAMIERATASALEELARRERVYRGSRPSPEVRGRIVILVDDGLATGSTMHAAVAALKQQQPARIVIAVPVAPPETCEEFRTEVDEVVCIATPEPFHAVGQWFANFAQLSDDEVRDYLERAGEEFAARRSIPSR
jgi:putative phosphoribosyl transferase